MFTEPLRPVHSQSPYPHGVHNDAARKYMGPPSSRPNSGLVIDPALAAPTQNPSTNRERSSRSVEITREEKTDLRGTTLILQKLEEQDNKLSKMSDSINDWKIQNGRLLAALLRSNSHALTQEEATGVLETMMDHFEFMVNAAYEARSGKDELEILRAENESMGTKLHTIALAMGSAMGNSTPNSTPNSQRFSSPMTASGTPSVLGKRKRTDARSRHSLLQNEVSLTDNDDLNDQSGLYAVSQVASFRTPPARQSEKPSSPLLSAPRVGQQPKQLRTPTIASNGKPIATPLAGGQTPAKTPAAMLAPPNSSLVEHYARDTGSAERDQCLNIESECFGNTAPRVNGSINEGSADFVEDQNTVGTAIVERDKAGTTAVDDPDDDRQEISPAISQPQRARSRTPKVNAIDGSGEPGSVVSLTEQREQSRSPPTEDEMAGLQSRETRTSAANSSRRKTTSALLEETLSRPGINSEKDQRRKTTNTLPEMVDINHTNGDESNRPTMQQPRMTKAVASHMDHMQEIGNADGYVEGQMEMSAELLQANLWLHPLMTTLTNGEEREELFEHRQNDQQSPPTNGNNKENEQPYYAHSADGAQGKQWSRRNRDPNRPKRFRRKPEEIQRKYKCLFPGCTKAYGELPHLNTHITDSSHGERWVKADYLEASKKQGDSLDEGMDDDDSLDLDRLVEERNAAEAVAALKRNHERIDRVEKLRQRDRLAKEAMEREERMELMNGV
jgi:hypothetical protein